MLAREAIANGVTHKTTQTRQKYWQHWRDYASLFTIDPFLQNSDNSNLEQELLICAFAARVRTGTYGRGSQIKVSGVSDALSAISKTFQLAGQHSPIYEEEATYKVNFQRLVEGFRREDPPSIPQLAVPITVPNQCITLTQHSTDDGNIATAQLIIIAFYYLLRVGEYTKPKYITRNKKKLRATRTVQFSIGNIGFFKNDKILPRTSPLHILLQADSCTLKITNQKNGRMGDTIHQRAIHTTFCPIQALARRVHHILSNSGTDETLLCDYYTNDEWHSVESKHIIIMIRLAAKTLQLDKAGIDPDLIAAHSLRAGGAMALKLHGYNDTTIMKMGRWTSLTFLQYIHSQIAHLSKDISSKMSMPLPFLNIASIEQH